MSEKNYADALQKIREEFGTGDPQLMAECSGADYQDLGAGQGLFTLTYLNKAYHITFPAGEISFASDQEGPRTAPVVKDQIERPAQILGCGRPLPQAIPIDYSGETILISDQTLILMYLKGASGLPARGQWVNFLQLPEGGHHYRPFIVDAIDPMVELFAGGRELFFEALAAIGGEPVQLGDYGGLITVFPKVILAAIIWEGDEEFPAKGNILFDANISTYLDTAGVYVMGINAAQRLKTMGDKLKDGASVKAKKAD